MLDTTKKKYERYLDDLLKTGRFKSSQHTTIAMKHGVSVAAITQLKKLGYIRIIQPGIFEFNKNGDQMHHIIANIAKEQEDYYRNYYSKNGKFAVSSNLKVNPKIIDKYAKFFKSLPKNFNTTKMKEIVDLHKVNAASITMLVKKGVIHKPAVGEYKIIDDFDVRKAAKAWIREQRKIYDKKTPAAKGKYSKPSNRIINNAESQSNKVTKKPNDIDLVKTLLDRYAETGSETFKKAAKELLN